jgi:hypothetical protein
MPSWALLVMTAVCKEVRKKTTELLTRIKQKTKRKHEHNNKNEKQKKMDQYHQCIA